MFPTEECGMFLPSLPLGLSLHQTPEFPLLFVPVLDHSLKREYDICENYCWSFQALLQNVC
jgi:hypothetical protein